jgi:TnpA family transposase
MRTRHNQWSAAARFIRSAETPGDLRFHRQRSLFASSSENTRRDARNKGEVKNALARAVFFNRLGEMRDRTFENQRYRASGLNLVVAAVILWKIQ